MRVLMLAQSYAPVVGGVEEAVGSLSRELVRRGHEVSVATLRVPGAGREALVDGVRVHRLGSAVHRIPGAGVDAERHHAPPFPDPETAIELRRLVHRERPQIVHAHNWIVNSYLPLDRGNQTALVLSMHDYGLVCATKRFFNRGAACTGPHLGKCMRCAVSDYGAVRGIPIAGCVRVSERRLRRHVDLFMPVSDAVRDRCGVLPGELHRVIPNFVDPLPPPRELDGRLKALPVEPFILYFGDVTVDKGVPHLIEAYKGLDQVPPLVLVGRCFLPELAEVPGVTALGAMPHDLAIAALQRSLFTVLPSLLPETFGLVALESAAAGKPVIASDIGGLRDVLVDGETGLLIPPGSHHALATAMRRLLDDEGLRERMGAAASRWAARFEADVVVPEIEEAYRLALDVRARRGAEARR